MDLVSFVPRLSAQLFSPGNEAKIWLQSFKHLNFYIISYMYIEIAIQL